MDQNDDFIRQFLYGPGTILSAGDHATADILMDEHMDGWIGIPHGGISMGIMMDLAMQLDAHPGQDPLRFPISAGFRFGGTKIQIGDLVHFDVTLTPGGAEGSATVREDGTLERVVNASGQWFGIQDLTRQMRSSLLPRTLMKRAFELATPPATH